MRLLTVVAGLALLASCRHTEVDHEAHADFPYRLKFETNETTVTDGNSIRITEVLGTRRKIEVGGRYLVRGTYEISDPNGGAIYFWGTAINWDNSGGTPDHQRARAEPGKGTFEMWRTVPGPLYLHVQMNDSSGKEVADTYFGLGDTLYESR